MSTLAPLQILYLLNFIWLGMGFVYFTLRTERVFAAGAKHLRRKAHPELVATAAGDEWHFDLLKYLGSMNAAVALSVLYQMIAPSGDFKIWLSVWGAVHASQAVIEWTRVYGKGRWEWAGLLLGMRTITYIDTLLWTADWAVAMAC